MKRLAALLLVFGLWGACCSAASLIDVEVADKRAEAYVRVAIIYASTFLLAAVAVGMGVFYGLRSRNRQPIDKPSRKLIRLLLIVWILLCAGAITAGFLSGLSNGRPIGYKIGHEKGAGEGYNAGYNDGYQKGRTAGQESQLQDSYQSGYKKGHEDGEWRGRIVGRKEGKNAEPIDVSDILNKYDPPPAEPIDVSDLNAKYAPSIAPKAPSPSSEAFDIDKFLAEPEPSSPVSDILKKYETHLPPPSLGESA